MALAIFSGNNMTTHQIGYACMTMLIISAFIFQAVCFTFNNWYRMDFGTFVLRTGLWEVRIYDEKNVTGMDALNHEKAEFRFYNSIWKSCMDRIDQIASKPPPKKKPKAKTNKTKTTKAPASHRRDQDPDIDSEFTDMMNDPDYNELEHLNFKPGENWFNLPPHIPDTVWDQMQGNIDAAEALYSITWFSTFILMCIFAFHQFLPWFQVTVTVMRGFCAALFITGIFALISVACYGNALPPICEHIANAYEKSPNPKFTAAVTKYKECSFGAGYSLSVLSGVILIVTGVMAGVRICQLGRGEAFDLSSAAGTAVSFGKTLVGGGITSALNQAGPQQQPQAAAGVYDWNQAAAPSDYAGGGYDQGAYQAGNAQQQGDWERLQ